jgi:FlaA1/EpsC-like NDP-sugar epimerase
MDFKLSSRAILLVIWDVLATYAALALAAWGTRQADAIFTSTDFLFLFGIMALINVAAFLAFRLYNSLWEYASTSELLQLLYASAIGMFAGACVHYAIGPRLPIRVYFVAWVLFLFFTGAARFLFRFMRRSKGIIDKRPRAAERKRTLVIGAGETGSLTINRLVEGDYAMQGKPVAAVDDDPSKIGHRIHGVKVMGSTAHILDLVKRYQIEQIVVAIPSAAAADRKRIYDICIQTNCRLLTLPNVRDLRIDELDSVRLREVELTDLLSREEIVLNTRLVSGYLAGKTVLITGGGGSIGSELARQVATVAPRRIVVFDSYENTAYELALEMRDRYDDIEFVVEIGSVRDSQRLRAVFETHRPDVVFHAAAHKHVPLMEANPREAVLNNVFGTLNTVRLAERFGVKNFIFISTDKAVNPSSVMGATKRLGEMIIQSFAQESDACFTAVRFGNVLGSHGSVIPMFKRQIAEGGPVTITHPDITRYFMTIPEASRLVVQAGGMATGGEIFILDMGEQVKILDLARNMIRLSGLTPDEDIEIKVVGLRPGEKLYEELLMDCEKTQQTSVKSILISTGEAVSHDEVAQKIRSLEQVLDKDPDTIRRCLAENIPTYQLDCL